MQTFILMTDQRTVAFVLDSLRCSKIKNDKIQQWRVELAVLTYVIKYRPGQRNTARRTWRARCSAMSTFNSLEQLHKELCHPGITRFLWERRTCRSLPPPWKTVVSNGKICAEVKPQFYRNGKATLVKSKKPMERLSFDFKGTVPSRHGNIYLLIVIDEHSRFHFVFPCIDMPALTVIRCLDELLTLYGTPSLIHSYNGPAFTSTEFKRYLHQRGIASSFCSVHHPSGWPGWENVWNRLHSHQQK